MPRSVEIVKEKYCRDRYEECARWRVHKALGGTKVPPNLFPSEAKEADDIISGAGQRNETKPPRRKAKSP